MPILAGPPSSPPGPGLVVPDVGYAVATWYAPDGSVWPLMDEDSGWFTLPDGISGLGAESIQITTDRRPRGGVRVRHIQPIERTITWGLHVYSDESHQEFVDRWRAVMHAFDQTSELGPGWLEIARPNGSARRIQAYYQEGFDGEAGLGVLSDSAVITLLCEDPYWQDATPTVIRRGYAEGVPYLAPYPTVSSAHVLGETTVTNPGQVIAWPEWLITGPASGLTATLGTTGEAFTIDPNATPSPAHGNLLAGEQVTIRTDPPQVRGPDGSNWIGALDWPGAELWGLPAREHQVIFGLAGAGPGSQVQLTFYPRYKSA